MAAEGAVQGWEGWGMPDEAGLSATNYTCTQSNQQAGYEPNE